MSSRLIGKMYTVAMIILLLGVLALQEGKFLGEDLFDSKSQERDITAFALSDIQSIFPEATLYREREDTTFVYQGSELLGWTYSSSPVADSIIGYTSSVPLLIGFDIENRVVGLTMLDNYESPDFVGQIVDEGFLQLWNRLDIAEVASYPIDAVSGATITSNAIIATLQHSIRTITKEESRQVEEIDYMAMGKSIAGYALLILTLIQLFFPKRFTKWRTPIKIVTILILGFWMGTFLSIFSLYSWAIYGMNLSTKLFALIILTLSVVLPLFTDKSYYCSYLCPFGASQDLVGKIRTKKMKLSPQLRDFLSTMREKVFATIMLLLFVGVSFDLTNIEPFSAFIYQSAALPVTILALLFLLLSIIIPRPWCRYACPTGHLLNIIRQSKK